MGVSLSKLAGDTSKVTITFNGGNSVTVSYCPAKITNKMVIQAQQAQKTNDIALALKETSNILHAVIKSWDLYEDDEMTRPYPLDVDSLEELPYKITETVLMGIMSDMSPEAQAARGR